MADPYLDASDLACRYYNLLGRIVTAWSRIERVVDITLYDAGLFYGPDADEAIVSWRLKHKTLKQLLKARPDYETKKGFIDPFLKELKKLGRRRNSLVHGYLGDTPDSEDNTFSVVSVRFDKHERRRETLNHTLDELVAILAELQKLEAKMAFVVLSQLTEKSAKAPPEAH